MADQTDTQPTKAELVRLVTAMLTGEPWALRLLEAMRGQEGGEPAEPEAAKAPLRRFSFPTAGDVFCLDPNATAMDVFDHLSARQTQLSALLALGYGAGGQAMAEYSEGIRDSYIWACHSLSVECEEMLDVLTGLQHRERGAEAA